MQETRVQSWVGKNLLGRAMATHSSTLAWKTPRTEAPGGLQSMGLQRVRHNWATSLLLLFTFQCWLKPSAWTILKDVDVLKMAASVRFSSVAQSCLTLGLQPTRLLHPWDFPGKSTGVSCHCLLCNMYVYVTLISGGKLSIKLQILLHYSLTYPSRF